MGARQPPPSAGPACPPGITHRLPSFPTQAGALVLLDACQSLPHRAIDVQALGCDWLVASGHKAGGPTSSGFLWGRCVGGGGACC